MIISNVKTARAARGLSQIELAKKVRCSQALICLIERDGYEPDAQLKKRIARALSQPVEMLFEVPPGDEGDR